MPRSQFNTVGKKFPTYGNPAINKLSSMGHDSNYDSIFWKTIRGVAKLQEVEPTEDQR